MTVPYLHLLTASLADRVADLSDDYRARHIDFLTGKQNPDGGFPGREGGSDVYYTAFALRGLAVLGALTPELAASTGRFLRGHLTGSGSVIDLFSLLVGASLCKLGGTDILSDAPADYVDRIATLFETFRTPDGGYAKAVGSPGGSTYHAFLVALALQLLDRPIPEPERLIAFVKGRRRDDGGYVEIAHMRRSGTNPTAAGIGVLQICEALDDESREAVIAFLLKLPSEFEGGFRANDRIPAADLLSTFTAGWTLDRLGALDRMNIEAVRDYAESVMQPWGGYRGGLWDEVADVEYTFYGIGVMALVGME